MNKALAAAPLLLTLLIVSCSSDLDRRYLGASLNQKLELPPDLIAGEVESNFELPSTITGDGDPVRGNAPVLARVESLQLESNGDMYWLSVEQPVDDLYRLVKDFWFQEGFRLAVDEPVLGIMQTEWVYKEEGGEHKPDNWFLALFDSDDLSATQDQFRTRIERGSGDRNRIYIAHRGTEFNYVLDTGKQSDNPFRDDDANLAWNFRQPEPELEVEMLSRLMLYLGLQQAGVDEQIANARLYQPRAFMELDTDENSPYLLVRNPYQIAWNRILHQLERMNFEIVSKEFKSGLLGEGVIVINAQVRENRESGGFFSFEPGEEIRERKIVLVFMEENHELTRVEIETADGDYDTSPEGAEFLGLLHRRIR